MKKYRDCIADAFVLQCLLEFLSDNEDSSSRDSVRYIEQADADEEDENGYYRKQAEEYRAKAAAYERLLTKLSK